MKRIVSLILVCVLVVLALSSCGVKGKYVWMNYDYSKYITLPDYSNLSVDLDSEEFLKYYTYNEESKLKGASLAETKEIKDGAAQKGDTVDIDFVGKIDGKEFDGGSSKGYKLTLGSGQFIEGFEDGLVGAKKGEKRELKLTFPKDYDEKFAGKDVVFSVTVNSISRTTYPEVDDKIAEKLGYKDLAEYKQELQTVSIFNFVMNSLIDKTKVDSYPDDLIDDLVNQSVEYYKNVATNSKMTLEDYLKNFGYTEKSFREMLKEDNSTLLTAKEYLVYYAICDAENLYPDNEQDYNSAIKNLADELDTNVDQIVNNYDERTIEISIVADVVESFILKNTKTK